MIGTILVLGGLTAITSVALATSGPTKPTAGKRRKRPRVGKSGRKPIRDCGVFPWLPEEVEEVLAYETRRDPLLEVDDLALIVLRTVYQLTPEGARVPWPAIAGDCATVQAIQERVRIRTRAHVACLREDLADRAWYESGGR